MSCFPNFRNLFRKRPLQESQNKCVAKPENGKVKAMISKFEAKEVPGQLPPVPASHKVISRECVTELKNNLEGKIKFGIHSPYSIQNEYLVEAEQICCFIDEEEGKTEPISKNEVRKSEEKILESLEVNKEENRKVANRDKMEITNSTNKSAIGTH